MQRLCRRGLAGSKRGDGLDGTGQGVEGEAGVEVRGEG